MPIVHFGFVEHNCLTYVGCVKQMGLLANETTSKLTHPTNISPKPRIIVVSLNVKCYKIEG